MIRTDVPSPTGWKSSESRRARPLHNHEQTLQRRRTTLETKHRRGHEEHSGPKAV